MPHAGDAPLFFVPWLRPQVWGGRRLATLLNKELPATGAFGEAWEISPLPAAISRIATGPHAGTTLTDAWRNGLAELCGFSSDAPFPWLVKWLDVEDRLSVQVHPDDEHARRLLNEPCGKSEVWVVVHAEPTAKVYAGFQAGVAASDVRQTLQSGRIVDCLHTFVPRVGDCISLPAGTVHAAGGGLLLAEVQQPSDATFRLYDWDRVGADGQPRALHIAPALECLAPQQGPVNPEPRPPASVDGVATLLRSPYFTLDRIEFTAARSLVTTGLSVWLVLEGESAIEWPGGERTLHRGDTMLVPPGVDLQVRPSRPVTFLRVGLGHS